MEQNLDRTELNHGQDHRLEHGLDHGLDHGSDHESKRKVLINKKIKSFVEW